MSLITRCSLTNISYYFPKIYFKRLFSQLVPFLRVVALETRLLRLVQVVSIVQHYAAFNIQQCCKLFMYNFCTISKHITILYCNHFCQKGSVYCIEKFLLSSAVFRCCNAEYSACPRKNKLLKCYQFSNLEVVFCVF